MKITSISLGDEFVYENGDRVRVTAISCACDETISLWETSIGYSVISNGKVHSTLDNVVKAREFVIKIQASDSGFVRHLRGAATSGEEITCTMGSGAGVAALAQQTKMEQEFLRKAREYGLKPGDLGRDVTMMLNGVGKKYVLVGANPRNHKYPILLRRLRNRKIYKFSVDRVKSALL